MNVNDLSKEVTALTIFMDVKGKTCLVPINPNSLQLFLGMLPTIQSEDETVTALTLYSLPHEVIAHVQAARTAIGEHMHKVKKAKEAKNDNTSTN